MNETTVVNEENIITNEYYPVLFKLGLKALIRTKSNELIMLRDFERVLLDIKLELAEKERKLILTTNFKELGLTNEKMRNAYVNEQLNDIKVKIDAQNLRIASKKDDIEIINDLIKFKELELKGE